MTDPHGRQAAQVGEPYRWEDLPPDLPKAILDALGGPGVYRTPPGEEPVRVVRAGVSTPWPARGKLILEDGAELSIEGSLPPDLPLGYHDFFFDAAEHKTRVIVVPGGCLVPGERQWGWAAQLYAARSPESWGIGDLADLRRLAAWSAGLGAAILLINPLHAVAPVLPQPASPYHPSSRRFFNPVYLRVEEVPGAERLGPRLEGFAAAGRALNTARRLDRDAVFRLKNEALQAIWAGFAGDPDFQRYRQEQGENLEQFATHCALAERYGEDWRQWPAEFHDPRGPAVKRFAGEQANRIRYHEWLQWLLDRQMAAAAKELTIVQDLPIGISPGGADAWLWQDLLAGGISIGAPPDAFSPEGQNWHLPPFVPGKLRAAAYEPFIQTIRATLRHAGGLRMDHVMGLFRLFWVPEGVSARQGAYVRYPADDLLGILALESRRAGAFVIGEDLGTVEDGVRERLAHCGVLSFRVLWFEKERPARYPQLSLAVATTHDLPTIAGLWTGWDEAAQEECGLPRNDEMGRLRRHFQELLGGDPAAPVAQVIEHTYRLLGQSPSLVILATLEDALAVKERPNMPSTTDKWPNWSLGLPGGLSELETSELPRRIARVLNEAVGGLR